MAAAGEGSGTSEMQFVHQLTSCETVPFGFFFQNGHGIAAAGQAECAPWSAPCFRLIADGSALLATLYSAWY